MPLHSDWHTVQLYAMKYISWITMPTADKSIFYEWMESRKKQESNLQIPSIFIGKNSFLGIELANRYCPSIDFEEVQWNLGVLCTSVKEICQRFEEEKHRKCECVCVHVVIFWWCFCILPKIEYYLAAGKKLVVLAHHTTGKIFWFFFETSHSPTVNCYVQMQCTEHS